MQVFAQAIEKSGARIDPQIVLLAINTKRDRDGILRGCRKYLFHLFRTLSQRNNRTCRCQQAGQAESREKSAARRLPKLEWPLRFRLFVIFALIGHPKLLALDQTLRSRYSDWPEKKWTRSASVAS